MLAICEREAFGTALVERGWANHFGVAAFKVGEH